MAGASPWGGQCTVWHRKDLYGAGDGIIIMQPVYYPFSAAITQKCRELVNNALIYEDYAYRIDFDDLEKKAERS